jgi:small subunit ribosomal protein S20
VANSPQARKRARQNDKRRTHNASLRSLVRTKIKQVMANRGIIKKNKAARHKSRLNARVKALAS